MARQTARKVVTHGAPIGGLVRADFKGADEFELHAYWMHPTRRASVEVPIFQHAFYPTLDMTDTDISQNIDYRQVIVPSIADLHAAGIETDKAIFVAEVWTHPRYIKNHNYLRNDFPANLKTLARINNMAIVMPANDMPFTRLKRKQVLNLYRAVFSPLIIKGRHYTSGRMNFFFTAPPHITSPLRKSLNLEHQEGEVQELTEASWEAAVQATRRKHKNDPILKPKTTPKKKVSKEIEETVYPVVASHFDIDPNSAEGRQLHRFMSDPRLADDFIRATANKPSRFNAVKRWVATSFWPRLKNIVATETGNALEDGARYVVRLAISIAFEQALAKMQYMPTEGESAKKTPRWRSTVGNFANRIDYNAAAYAAAPVGTGVVKYKPNRGANVVDTMVMVDRIKTYVFEIYYRLMNDDSDAIAIKDFFKIVITPQNLVNVSLDETQIQRMVRQNPDACGIWFPIDGTPPKVNMEWVGKVKAILPRLSMEATKYYKDISGLSSDTGFF